MTDTDKLSAMEAAARALAVENGLDPDDPTYQIGAMNPDRPVWMDHLCDARAAILAYLETLAGDEKQDAPGTVEQCMKAVLKSWKHAGVTCSPDLEGSELAARAVLKVILQRAKGDAT
jgi:hypothetical protein